MFSLCQVATWRNNFVGVTPMSLFIHVCVCVCVFNNDVILKLQGISNVIKINTYLLIDVI